MAADGSRFADLTGYVTIEIRSTDTGQVMRTLNAVSPIDWYAIGPTGRQVAAGDYFGRVEAWNGSAVKPQILGSPGPAVLDVAYNLSGTEFVTASASGTVTVWDARHNRQVNVINACPSPSTAMFSPNGSKIVVACGDGTIRVFEADSGQALTITQATTAGIVNEAVFSPGGLRERAALPVVGVIEQPHERPQPRRPASSARVPGAGPDHWSWRSRTTDIHRPDDRPE
jgi:WD40 repeat protein